MRAYGWDNAGHTIPAEAGVIQEIATRVTQGDSLRTIATDLNARKVPTSSGRGKWSPIQARRIVTNPRAAGLRESASGGFESANIEPILDRTVWEKVRALLLDPERTAKYQSTGSAPKALLSRGIIRCGRCGSPMHSGGMQYQCSTRTPGGCGSTSIRRAPLDADVAERVLARVTDAGVRRRLMEVITDAGDIEIRMRDLRERQAALADDYAAGLIPRSAMLKGTARAQEMLEEAQEIADRVAVVGDLPTLDVADVVAWWEASPIERQREVVRLFLRNLTVLPTTDRRTGQVDEARLRYVWFGD